MMDEKNVTKGIKRHRAVYSFLRIVVGDLFMRFRGVKYQKYCPKSKTFLLLGNHTQGLDPVYAVVTTGRHLRFVSSANILKGFSGWIIRFLFGPIPRVKGAHADDTVEKIVANLNAGVSVAMYPEGKRTTDGQTGFISKRTAEILKKTDCGLVTMRTEGGALRKPRWGHQRKGKIFAKIIGEYTTKDLSLMTVDEIYEIILRDLYTDAYEWQKEHRIVYPCDKGRAEGIERVLVYCPECGAFGKHRSNGDRFLCTACGKEYYLDEYDLIHATDKNAPAKFDAVTAWNDWQKNALFENRRVFKVETLRPLFTDNGVSLAIDTTEERKELFSSGSVSMYGDRLEAQGEEWAEPLTFFLSDIEALGGYGNSNLFFTCHGEHYRFYGKGKLYEYKYFLLWRVLTDRRML